MAAGDQQRDEREFRRPGLELRRQQVTFQMMHADDRHAPGIAQAARDRRPDKQRADQAGTRRIGNAINGLRTNPGVRKAVLDHRQQPFYVLARGKLGHHAAVGPVQLDLAPHAIGHKTALAVVHGDRGLVAGGFDAKHSHEASLLIFRGQITTIPGPFPGAVPGVALSDEV